MSFHLRDIFTEEEYQCFDAWSYAWLKKQTPNVNKEYWRGYREGKQEILDKYAELEKQGEKEANGNEREFPNSEQKPTEWHREDEQNLNVCLGYIPDESLRRWLMDVVHVKYDKPTDKYEPMSLDEAIEHCKEKSCGNNACALEHKQLEKWLTELRELKEQNPAWSEEDENHIQHISDFIMRNRVGDTDAIYRLEQDVNWLKSLKERVGNFDDGYKVGFSAAKYQWKPSGEQMTTLLSEVKGWTKGCPKQIVLESLYNDLKKLKE